MNVVVAGGTGFVGKALTARLHNAGHRITLVSRSVREGAISWSDEAGLRSAVERADAVVNLCGASVAGKRWDASYKAELRDSRLIPTKALAVLKPSVLVQASAVGWYGDGGDRLLTESDPAANDFFGRLCADWEAAASEGPGRVCFLRLGQVLGRGGGSLEAMLNPPMLPVSPWKLGLGGPLGSGRQWVPWIHLDDAVGMFVTALEDAAWNGAVNAVAPHNVRAEEFARALGRVLDRPSMVPTPAFALRLMLGEFTDFLLASQRVGPVRALALGYEFRFADLATALTDLLGPSSATR
jgi:hypothetical protein